MFSSLKISHFQSLYDIDLELDRFTVIVGPSSSGKSALTRALLHLTSNTAGLRYLTHGENIVTVQAETEKGTVVLKRSSKTSDNEYILIPNDPSLQQKTFTKLGGTVPEEVTKFLGIPAKDALNYAGQWDSPFLLKNPASEVARVLGELTNVNVVFEAARESNRQKTAHSSKLKTRSTDLQLAQSQLEKYEGLDAKLEAIKDAENLVAEAHELERRLTILRSLIETVEVTSKIYRELKDKPAPEIPDITEITELQEKIARLRLITNTIVTEATKVKTASDEIKDISAELETLERDRISTLEKAGTCPTCGQNTEGLHGH